MNKHKRFWVVLGAFLSVGLLIAGVLYSRPSTAAPTISWTPGAITTTVVPGQTQVVPASFTPSENMSNAVVRVDPALQSVVKLLPANLANVQKGQTVTLSIVFSASPTALPGSFQGAIRLLVGSTTIVEPLPVTVLVTAVPLPPDPGEAGKATLEGIDSDHDGVRDDIQRYIGFIYPESARMRASLKSFAVGMQMALLSGGSAENAALARSNLSNAQDCLWYLQGRASIQVWQELRAQYLNTLDRSHAYTAYARLLTGAFFTTTPDDQRKSRCEFDPDALPN